MLPGERDWERPPTQGHSPPRMLPPSRCMWPRSSQAMILASTRLRHQFALKSRLLLGWTRT
eukprot:12626013-Alexandrium_andersonii.AAC.1